MKLAHVAAKRLPVWVTALVAIAGIIGGTIIGSDAAAISDLEASLAASEGDTAELRDSLSSAEGDLSEMSDERDALVDEVESLEGDVRSMSGERDRMADERDQLLVRFDPQIQALIAGLQQKSVDAACGASTHAGYTGGNKPAAGAFIDAVAGEVPDGLLSADEAAARVDKGAVASAIDGCFGEGQRKAEADRLAAERQAAAERLYKPFSDGIYTVGVEIAAGRWRSDGTNSNCYWKRAPDGRPDDITDNHLGPAGGTVILSPGEEFHSERCGNWQHLGG